jgi:O-antigen/teichoic acid export membrane protein
VGGGTHWLDCVYLLLSPGLLLSLYTGESLKARGHGLNIATATVLPQLLYTIALSAAFFAEFPLTMLQSIGAMLLANILTFLTFRPIGGPSSWRVGRSLAMARRNKLLGVKIYKAALVGQLTAQSGIYLAEFLAQSRPFVAEFAAALTMALPINMIGLSFGSALFSRMARSGLIFRQAFFALLLLSALVAVFIGVAAKSLLLLVFGPSFAGAESLVQILVFAAFLHSMGDYSNRKLQAIGRTEKLQTIAILVCLATIGGGYILWTLIGPLGIALGRLLGSSVHCLSTTYLAFKLNENQLN